MTRGSEWSETAIDLDDLDPGDSSEWYPSRLGVVDSVFVLIGEARSVDPFESRIALWVSEDLKTWTHVDASGVFESTRLWHTTPTEWDGGLVIWGVGCDDGGSCWEPQLQFVSSDGISWTRKTPDQRVFALVDATFVFEGGAGLVAFSGADGSIWQSTDGIAWTPVDADGSALTARRSGLAFTGDEFVVLGLTEDDRWTSWIWSQDG